MAFRLLEFAMLTGSVSVIFLAVLVGLAHMEFFLAVSLSGPRAFYSHSSNSFSRGSEHRRHSLIGWCGCAFRLLHGLLARSLFIVALSLYDYIAVFKTRHMLALAEHLGERNCHSPLLLRRKRRRKRLKPKAAHRFHPRRNNPPFPHQSSSMHQHHLRNLPRFRQHHRPPRSGLRRLGDSGNAGCFNLWRCRNRRFDRHRFGQHNLAICAAQICHRQEGGIARSSTHLRRGIELLFVYLVVRIFI